MQMTTVQASALLIALSTELAAMKGSAENLSSLMAELVQHSQGEARTRALVEAQAIDELTQKLDALRGLTWSLARGDAVETAIDAVLLAEVAGRLRRAVLAGESVAVAPGAAGELMLFE